MDTHPTDMMFSSAAIVLGALGIFIALFSI